MSIDKGAEANIRLEFRRSGSAYSRAIEVANFMEMDIEAYLLQCIKEGHKVLQQRMARELELPTFLRDRKEDQEVKNF